MANIPIHEKQAPPQTRPPHPPMRPAAPYNRPGQYQNGTVPKNMQRPQGIPQRQRITPPANGPRQNASPQRPMHPRAATEQLRPIKNPPKNAAPTKKSKGKSKQKKDFSKLKDFILAFTVSLVLFGIAAIVVCNALISLFT